MKTCIYLQPASYPKVYHFDIRCYVKGKKTKGAILPYLRCYIKGKKKKK